jgi:DNA-binding Lrp family transcriptional regulator
MKVVVRVDAAPGFETAVEQNLRRAKSVVAVGRQKLGNYDLVVLVDVPDDAGLERVLSNELRTISGVRAIERVAEPDASILKTLVPLG